MCLESIDSSSSIIFSDCEHKSKQVFFCFVKFKVQNYISSIPIIMLVGWLTFHEYQWKSWLTVHMSSQNISITPTHWEQEWINTHTGQHQKTHFSSPGFVVHLLLRTIVAGCDNQIGLVVAVPLHPVWLEAVFPRHTSTRHWLMKAKAGHFTSLNK